MTDDHRLPPEKPETQSPPSAPVPESPLFIWECPNCGQSYFGEETPDLCDYCQDFTTWRRVRHNE